MAPKYKNAFITFTLRLSSVYLRSRICRLGKQAYWNRCCVPRLCWRDDELVARTSFGAGMYVRPSDFLENRILFFGVWEPAITELFQTVRSGDVVIDVGANVGYYTLLASKIVGKEGHVYAIEASPSTRTRLQRNLDLNSVTNVTVVPFAAWHEAGQATLTHACHNSGAGTLRRQTSSGPSEVVDLIPLDTIIPGNHAQNISLIKMDIEGAECHALGGLRETLQRATRARLICEVNPQMLKEMGASADQLFDELFGLGFEAARIDERFNTISDAMPYLYPVPPQVPISLPSAPTVPMDVLFTRVRPLTARTSVSEEANV